MNRKIVKVSVLIIFFISIVLSNVWFVSYAQAHEKEQQLIKDGIYRISMHGNNYCHFALEIENGSKQVEANVQLGTWINKNNEKNKFKITYDQTSGYYTIQSLVSGNMLDVQNGGMISGTNVWQHGDNGTDAQKWRIEKNNDGSYSFISKKNGLYLDVQNGNMSDGGNIQVFAGNNTQAQKFQLISLDDRPEKTIENGIYKIETFSNANKVIEIENASNDNGANIRIGQWSEYGNTHKKFKLTYNEDDGYYTIEALNSEKVFDAQDGGMTDGTNLWQYAGNYTDAQRWKIEKNSDNSYSFICKKSGLYLDVNNENVETNTKSHANTQKFNIIEVETTNPSENIEEGTYKIVVASNQNLSIDVQNSSREMAANIILGNVSDVIRNEFNIRSAGNGYYTISSINSGNVLDVANGGMTSGTNVWQHGINGTDAQKWIIRYNAEDDTYSIISKKNGLYLDVQNGNITNGGNIQVATGNNTKAQKFKLIKQEAKTEKYLEEGLYKVLTKLNGQVGFDIESASKLNGGTLQIWEYQNFPQQQFNIEYKNGYYYIINLNSNMAIQADNTNILQYEVDYSNDNQKWIIKYVDGQYYSIISKTTGLCINIPSTSAINGTDLKLSTYNENNNQVFKFENIGTYIDDAKYPGIKERLDRLKASYPEWEFEILYTGLNFSDVVNGEYSTKTNCLVDTSIYQDEWVDNNPYHSGVWYSASQKAIAYFMDTRNFLNEIDIFQFLDLNNYATDSVTLNGIKTQVKGTFLENYANDINNASYNQNVNPYYVIARLFQEQGRGGTPIGTGMYGGDGKTYYNPFNIGAKLGNDYETALATAKSYGWDSMEKAITGGIDFLKDKWLENYQNTLYQNKFDIDTRNGTSLFTHEYMQNLSAAYSEARILQKSYVSTNKLNSNFKFIIPVYENMPSEISEKPSNKTSNSGPVDVKVVNVSSSLNLRAEPSTNSKILAKLSGETQLLSIKRSINGNWHQVVTDNGIIGYASGDYLKIIADRTNCNKQKVVKTADGVGVKTRIGPSIYVDQVGTLPEGTVVTSINTGTYYIDGHSWDRLVLNDGRQVFVSSAYLIEK